LSDEAAWRSEYGSSHDPSALGIERNVLRYRPAEVTIRLGDGGSLDELLRVVAAGVRARATMRISSPVPLPSGMLPLVSGALIRVDELTVEGDAAWLARTARALPERIRLVGGDHAALIAAVNGSTGVAIWAGPVTTAGRVEMLPFLREQAVSITAHRFGAADREIAALEI
jgi:RHH-type proline utilization regulon transcriptional repressor/proline dehydrogenase/delta 1-pyrroline-5-carboxylate dehydrogenase